MEYLTSENIVIVVMVLWVAFENIIAAVPSLKSNSTCQLILAAGNKIKELVKKS